MVKTGTNSQVMSIYTQYKLMESFISDILQAAIYQNALVWFETEFDVITMRPHVDKTGQSRRRAVGCRWLSVKCDPLHSESHFCHTGRFSAPRARRRERTHRQICRTAGRKVLVTSFSFIFSAVTAQCHRAR